MTDIGQGLAGLGAGIGAWGQVYKRRQQEDELAKLWTNILTPPTDPNTPDTFAGAREVFKGADPKTLARVMGSDAFSPQGLKALASINGKGGSGSNLIAGESIQAGFPNADLKGYIFKQNENGDWATLVKPERNYSLSPGQYLLDPKDNSVLAQAPERMQLANISQGGQLRLVNPNTGDSYILAERAPAPSNSGGGGGNTPNVILQVPGVGPDGNPMVNFYEFQRGKNGAPGQMVQPVAVGEKPQNIQTAGRIVGLKQGSEQVDEIRGLLYKPDGSIDRGALASKSLGLPGVVAPKGAMIGSKILQAIDPYVRSTTGAQLNEQEMKNAATMFEPGALDGDAQIKDKLDRLQGFLSGTNDQLMSHIAVPGSALSKALSTKNAKPMGATGGAPPTISSQAEYDKLPVGAPYLGPDGKQRIKK